MALLLGGALALGGAWATEAAAQADTDDAEAPAEDAPAEGEDAAAEGEDEAADDAEADAADSDAVETDAADGDAVETDADQTDAAESGADEGEADAAEGEDSGLDAPAEDEGVTEEGVTDEGLEAASTTDLTPASTAEPGTSEETATELASPEEAAEGSALEEGDLEEAEEEAAEDEEAPAPSGPEPVPWRNTFFNWTNQATFNSFLRDAQLSYNPVYVQSFSLSPRWYVLPDSFFWANIGMQLEITDTEGNALNRDPQLTDAVVEFRHLMPWEGFVFIGQMRLGFPTSKVSQASQRYLQTGLGMTIVRPFTDIGLTVAGLLAYRRWWAGSNVIQVGEPQPDRCAAPFPTTVDTGAAAPEINTATCDQLGTPSAGRDIFLGGISATWVPFAGFNINLSAFLFTIHGFELADYVDTEGDVITRPEDDPLVIADGSPSHWRNFTFISVSVGYQFLPWLNVSVGIQNSGLVAPAYNPDGSIRNPLFTPDTQVFLTGTFQLDEIYTQLSGGGEELTPEERQRRRQGLASGPSVGGAF
ncbi:MAG TPA: hypothetical protein RMH99_14270 [Sandaracinaceae bacterium LLY-WYZ-13_1]|nr:hypothetical protein [Sandaracinaceae bacterium LLY-WYZ-13_1]